MLTAMLLTLVLQSQTVTFEHPCAHSSVVLEALGKELGRTIKPSGSVNKDYFLVRFDNVPVKEAMDKIAATLNASWSEERGVLYLGRTRKQEADEILEEQREQIAVVEKWLTKNTVRTEFTPELARSNVESAIAYESKSKNAFDMNDYNANRELERNSPIGRLLLRILGEIGARQIAATDEIAGATYSSNPTSTEVPLANGEAMRSYETEMNVVDRAVSVGQAEALRTLNRASVMLPRDSGSIGKQDLTLTITRTDSGISALLNFGYGRWAYEHVPFASETGEAIPEELRTQQGDYIPTEAEASLSKHLRTIFMERKTSLEGTDTSALSYLRDPARNEPLTVYGSNWILESSKALNKNAIVLLPDEAFLVSFISIAQSRNGFRELWGSVPNISGKYSMKVEGDWLTAVPWSPRKARGARIDRRAWSALIARHEADVPAPLEEKTGYLALTDNDMLSNIAAVNSIILFMDLSLVELGHGEREPLRIFGRLRPDQQKAARNGGLELSLSNLPYDLIKPATKILYSQNTEIETERSEIAWDSSVRAPRPASDGWPRRFSGVVPQGSVMRVFVIGKDMIYQQRTDGISSQSWSEQNLGQHLACIERQPQESDSLLPYYTIGRTEQVIVEFEFPGIGFVYKSSQVPLLPRQPKFVSLDELPDEVKSAVYKAREAARKMYDRIGGGGR